MMRVELTAAAERALAVAARWQGNDGRRPELAALLVGLLAESECRAASMLAARAVDLAAVRRRWPGLREGDASGGAGREVWLEVFRGAEARLGGRGAVGELATEHLLLGLAASGSEAAEWLEAVGLGVDTLTEEVRAIHGWTDVEVGEPLEGWEDDAESASHDDVSIGSEQVASHGREESVWRVLDAAENRAREGLRVAEDYARFVLDDASLTEALKRARHRLAAATAGWGLERRLATRDTVGDVGTGISTERERVRVSTADVAAANLRRAEEALRSIEEFGKVVDARAAAEAEQIRYAMYTIEKRIGLHAGATAREWARLYVLVDGGRSSEDFERRLRGLFEAGVQMVQLRDKEMDDRGLVARGKLLSAVAREYGATWVMNDRADLAVVCAADGVHVGQEELSVADASAIVGSGTMVGVSTHSVEQARMAVAEGADYLGVGPTFASGTKSFAELAGVELLEAVSKEVEVPAYAIGGIDATNIHEVLAAGMTRVAVRGAVWEAEDVGTAARELLERLS